MRREREEMRCQKDALDKGMGHKMLNKGIQVVNEGMPAVISMSGDRKGFEERIVAKVMLFISSMIREIYIFFILAKLYFRAVPQKKYISCLQTAISDVAYPVLPQIDLAKNHDGNF